jgi:S-adenosylmethionine synthetase
MTIQITASSRPFPDQRPVEIVERKGAGHPDTISDALAEEFSLALSRYYLEEFSAILHHNVDKVLLWGGAASPAFGGGELNAPIEIYLAGRAVTQWKGRSVPVEELARESCGIWLEDHLRFLRIDQNVRLHFLVRPGSMDLEELFRREEKGLAPLANDTSCGVGFAPFSELENIVYDVEHYLNFPEIKEIHPEAGEDIKVMGVRKGDDIHLTIGCAFVDRYVKDLDDYLDKKTALARTACNHAEMLTGRKVTVEVNTADAPERDSIDRTVTGTSAEAGDDGQAGRGNRANGLITPGRPMTMESVAGKNPITHVGKLYNVAAGMMARAIAQEVPQSGSVECALVSQIGKPIDEPQICDIQLVGMMEPPSAGLSGRIEEIAREHIKSIPAMWRAFAGRRLHLDTWPHESD